MLNPSRTWPGVTAAGLVLILVVTAIGALLVQAPALDAGSLWQDPYLRHVTWFSFKQATLSTLLSTVLAIPVALALSRRHFPGRALILKLFAMTLVLPVLVGVFGILAIYGNNGLLANHAGSWFSDGQWPLNVYGLGGILLAHVFFNLPFAAQLLVQALERIPADQRRLAIQLGITGRHRFRLLEWPFIRQQLPHIAGLVFMLCFTSFATVMALGGGPGATTIELAIYQAIRFDFDLQTGALLALWQLLLCGLFHGLLQRTARPVELSGSDGKITIPRALDSPLTRAWDTAWIVAALLLVLPPLVMVVTQGINPDSITVLADPALWRATWQSLKLALSATALAFVLGAAIVLASRHWRFHAQPGKADGLELAGSLILVVPGVVLSTGLFFLLRTVADVFGLAFWLVLAVNSLMALPYMVKVLSQPAYQLAQQYNNLCTTLGVKGLARLKLVEWQVLRPPLAKALAVSFVLSTGDLGAIALVGSQDFETLPFYLFRLMGSYQMEAGASAALVLLALSLGCYALIEKLLIRKHHADGQ